MTINGYEPSRRISSLLKGLIRRQIIKSFKINIINSRYYAEACNEFAAPVSASLRLETLLFSKKCRSGGEPLQTLYPIWPTKIQLQTSRYIKDERVIARFKF